MSDLHPDAFGGEDFPSHLPIPGEHDKPKRNPMTPTDITASVGEPTQAHSPEHRRQFIAAMLAELDHAYAKHGARPWSRHEFFAVMKEEVDEAWDAIKGDEPMPDLLKEVMQIACVCLRYAETPDAYRGTHPLPLPSRAPAAPVEKPAAEPIGHGRNCGWWAKQDEADCTCGHRLRVALATEQMMHAAWRKRAEEAESALAANHPALARIDELEAANAKFAVRIKSCEHMLACYRVGRRPSDIALDTARETADAVDADPICSAAIEKART